MFRRVCEEQQRLLVLGKKWHTMARRYKKNPIGFCDKIMGPSWFELPDSSSARHVQELLKTVAMIGNVPTSPEEIHRLDAQQLLKQLQALATRSPGRKPEAIHTQALALRQTTPPMGFHVRLCDRYPAVDTWEVLDSLVKSLTFI